MYKNGVYILVLFVSVACSTNKEIVVSSDQASNDSAEYELVIFETGFDAWFATNRKPEWYFSHDYYRYRNNLMTKEWNYQATQRFADIPYDYPIYYDPGIDYGFEVDYQLYWYFKFVEHKYNIKLDYTTTQ